MPLQFVLLQLFHQSVYTVKLLGDVYLLRTMGDTLAATYAVAGLPERGYRTVIPHQKSTASLAVIGRLAPFGHVAFIDTTGGLQQYRGDVYPIGTRHAILAVIAGNGGKLHHQVGRGKEKLVLLLTQHL